MIPAGASVTARVFKDAEGKLALFTDEALFAGNTVIPKGVRLPPNSAAATESFSGINDKLIVTTALEPFSLVHKGFALCGDLPVGAVSALSNLGVCLARTLSARTRLRDAVHHLVVDLVRAGRGVRLLRDFSAGGQISARTGVGLSTAAEGERLFRLHHYRHAGNGSRFSDAGRNLRSGANRSGDSRFLVRIWKTALIVILIGAAVLSPTSDIPNMLLFAAPMMVLYIFPSSSPGFSTSRERRR